MQTRAILKSSTKFYAMSLSLLSSSINFYTITESLTALHYYLNLQFISTCLRDFCINLFASYSGQLLLYLQGVYLIKRRICRSNVGRRVVAIIYLWGFMNKISADSWLKGMTTLSKILNVCTWQIRWAS